MSPPSEEAFVTVNVGLFRPGDGIYKHLWIFNSWEDCVDLM